MIRFWEVVRERKRIVILAFLITVLTTFFGSILWPPKYEGTATMVLDYDSSNPMNLSIMPTTAGMATSSEYINTQIEIINSRKVAMGVIDRLKLDQISDIREDFNKAKNNPITFWKNKKNLEIKEWLFNEVLSKYLTVEAAKDSRFLYIKYYSRDPDFSALVANAYAKVYTDYSLELKVVPFKDAGQWFSDKLKNTKERADQASEQLLKYQKRKGIISQEGRYYDDAVQSLDQFNSQMVAAKGKLYEAKVATRRVEESKGSYESLPEVISNSFIQNLKTERIKLETSLSELSGKMGTKHPQYLRLQSELQTVNTKLDAEIKTIINAIKQDYNSANERVTSLEKAVASQKSEVLNLKADRYEADSLNRESETFKQAYEVVLKKVNETVLQGDINRTNVFLVDSAVPPTDKYSPKLLLNMVLSVFVGLFLGIGLAFFFDYLDDTIKSGEALESKFSVPVLGVLTPMEEK